MEEGLALPAATSHRDDQQREKVGEGPWSTGHWGELGLWAVVAGDGVGFETT